MTQKNPIGTKKRRATSQQILLDYRGNILDSNDHLFATTHLKDRSVADWLPFIESILPVIADPTFAPNTEITFRKVQTENYNLPGIYDFSFIKTSHPAQIIWNISDRTKHYVEVVKKQQRRNQAFIEQEHHNIQSSPRYSSDF
jgi:hypothetical protein